MLAGGGCRAQIKQFAACPVVTGKTEVGLCVCGGERGGAAGGGGGGGSIQQQQSALKYDHIAFQPTSLIISSSPLLLPPLVLLPTKQRSRPLDRMGQGGGGGKDGGGGGGEGGKEREGIGKERGGDWARRGGGGMAQREGWRQRSAVVLRICGLQSIGKERGEEMESNIHCVLCCPQSISWQPM